MSFSSNFPRTPAQPGMRRQREYRIAAGVTLKYGRGKYAKPAEPPPIQRLFTFYCGARQHGGNLDRSRHYG
jgi:hypothetical protein